MDEDSIAYLYTAPMPTLLSTEYSNSKSKLVNGNSSSDWHSEWAAAAIIIKEHLDSITKSADASATHTPTTSEGSGLNSTTSMNTDSFLHNGGTHLHKSDIQPEFSIKEQIDLLMHFSVKITLTYPSKSVWSLDQSNFKLISKSKVKPSKEKENCDFELPNISYEDFKTDEIEKVVHLESELRTPISSLLEIVNNQDDNSFKKKTRKSNKLLRLRCTKCIFCIEYGQSETNHLLTNKNGRILCPVLHRQICSECDKTGNKDGYLQNCRLGMRCARIKAVSMKLSSINFLQSCYFSRIKSLLINQLEKIFKIKLIVQNKFAYFNASDQMYNTRGRFRYVNHSANQMPLTDVNEQAPPVQVCMASSPLTIYRENKAENNSSVATPINIINKFDPAYYVNGPSILNQNFRVQIPAPVYSNTFIQPNVYPILYPNIIYQNYSNGHKKFY